MGEFFFFVLILFGAFWGSATLYIVLRAIHRKIEGSSSGDIDDALLAAMREELDDVATRLALLEDDVRFFTELNSEQRKLPESSEAEGDVAPDAPGSE